MSGPENSTIPAVADTDKINPKSTAHHGFHNNINSVARARRGIPEPGLPLNKDNMTTIAITAARRTLGCGVTKTTKAISVTAAAINLTFLPAPHSATIDMTLAVTIAQFAPETAVM